VSSGETGPELRTDEELQELITGELRPHNAPITLAEYDPGDRDLYLRAKRELAQRTWRHVQHYADAKTAVVQEIMDRASAAT
jgi:GrpB-like predicted nucleotidyltransferase (UPF0157 family)